MNLNNEHFYFDFDLLILAAKHIETQLQLSTFINSYPVVGLVNVVSVIKALCSSVSTSVQYMRLLLYSNMWAQTEFACDFLLLRSLSVIILFQLFLMNCMCDSFYWLTLVQSIFLNFAFFIFFFFSWNSKPTIWFLLNMYFFSFSSIEAICAFTIKQPHDILLFNTFEWFVVC